MPQMLLRLVGKLHVGLYRLTNGRAGGSMRGAPILLLTTTGRRTGKRRTTPLLYLRDGDDVAVVASSGGNDRAPAWSVNLRHEPRTTVRIRGETAAMTSRVATPDEKARLWPQLAAMYPPYDSYQERTERQIPVIILQRDG